MRTGLEPATPCVTGMYSNQAELPHLFEIMYATGVSPIASAKVVRFFDLCKFLRIFFKKTFCCLCVVRNIGGVSKGKLQCRFHEEWQEDAVWFNI